MEKNKDAENNYLSINRKLWNNKTPIHLASEFYDNQSFLKGRNSLNAIEKQLLGNVSGKRILHLQCHFGQDSISLSRMGAKVTGVDFSDKAIETARELALQTEQQCTFVCCDVYELKKHLDQQFDMVFTSYGTIGWLPDLEKWAEIVSHFLMPGGTFVMAEFHPFVWMYDDQFSKIAYSYFNREIIVEEQSGTYTDGGSQLKNLSVSWNHPLSDVLQQLMNHQLKLTVFNEFDYSPYNCFNQTIEVQPGQFQIQHLAGKIPMVYALKATKTE
ncbi:class I SAM-dependent methyltransferase [Roseimarinus sediminis]|uniref:class I SAM-dependent methyltransferase n=1 Tax=Roseimarinus sediminis TaxID=1610899 RepID=UPI003D1CDE27